MTLWNPPDPPSEPFYFALVASPFDADASALEAYYTGDCLRWQVTIEEAEQADEIEF